RGMGKRFCGLPSCLPFDRLSLGWPQLDRGMVQLTGSQIWTNSTGDVKEGTGMLGLNFSLPSSPRSSADALHAGPPLNWSAYDRLVLWILPLNVSPPLTFNIPAFVGTTLAYTTEQLSRPGCPELA